MPEQFANQTPVSEQFDQLAQEFTTRLRHGEHPSWEEYASRYPALAEDIRAYFPMIALMEEEVQEQSVAPPVPELRVNDQLGKNFQILRLLGEGGMGKVFLAWQRVPKRQVALKVLPPHRLTKSNRQRFRKEANILADLFHPNIIPVFAAGEIKKHCYIAMQLVEERISLASGFSRLTTLADAGADLDNLGTPSVPSCPGSLSRPADSSTAKRPLEKDLPKLRRHIVESIARVADALDYAYRVKKILHRDIKPANLLLHQNNVWVTDFGLAAFSYDIDPDQDATVPRWPGGTPGYVAPECLHGKIDHRSDIYSLGITLFELLVTQSAPNDAEAKARAERIKGKMPPCSEHPDRPVESPPQPRKIDPSIEPDLEAIILKAVALDPQQRFQTADELRDDLRRFLNGDQVRSRVPPPWEQLWKWIKRRPYLAASIVGFFVAFGVIFWLWSATAAANEQLGSLLYSRTIDLAHRDCKEERLAQAAALLATCQLERRNFEWGYLHLKCQREPLRLVGHTGRVRTVTFSPDGQWLASAGNEGGVRLWNVTTGACVRQLVGQSPGVRNLSFSRDGRLLASSSEARLVQVHDTATGELRCRLPGAGKSVALSPDGSQLLTDAPDGKIWLWDAMNGKRLRHFGKPCELVSGVTCSPDGKRFAAASMQSVRLWEWQSGREMTIPRNTDHLGNCNVAFSPDEIWLCGTADNASQVAVWDARTGAELRSFRATAPDWSNVASIAFGPAGRIACRDNKGNVLVHHTTTGKTLTLASAARGKSSGSVAFSADGRRLAWTEGGDVLLLDLQAPSRTDQVLGQHEHCIGSAAWSGDGSRIVSASADKIRRKCTCKIWDAQQGRLLHTLETAGDKVLGVGFAANGKQLISVDCLGDWGKTSVRVWDAETGTSAGVKAQFDAGEDAALSPDGQMLLLGMGREARLFDLAGGGEERRLGSHQGLIAAVALGSKGRLAVTGSYDKTAMIWNLETGTCQATFDRHDDRIQGACLSPDGQLAATASCDGTVRLWETATGREKQVLSGHHGEVVAVCFSPDGQRLASGGIDGTVRIWDRNTGQFLLSLEGHRGMIRSVAFSPDGRRLLSAGDDKYLRVWNATPPTNAR